MIAIYSKIYRREYSIQHQQNHNIKHHDEIELRISWINFIPAVILYFFVLVIAPACFLLFGRAAGLAEVIMMVVVAIGCWIWFPVWCFKVFWMAFTTRISPAGITQKYRKGYLEMEWAEVTDAAHKDFDYIIASKNGQEIHLNWVLFANWREIERFIAARVAK